jgi:hypothetical protein
VLADEEKPCTATVGFSAAINNGEPVDAYEVQIAKKM